VIVLDRLPTTSKALEVAERTRLGLQILFNARRRDHHVRQYRRVLV
jgi:hypothetical protein